MRRFIPIILAIACASCSTAPAPVTPAVVQAAAHRGKMIARVVSRRTTIEIYAGAAEPTYSVESNNGAVLARDMTIGQLELKSPSAFSAVKGMQDQVIWAGIGD